MAIGTEMWKQGWEGSARAAPSLPREGKKAEVVNVEGRQ